jgi:hypothetical protein
LSILFFILHLSDKTKKYELSQRKNCRDNVRIICKAGYNSTGINQIIADAGVAKASFYLHFKSKEDLCVEFLNVRHQYWFSELNTFLSKEKR